MKILYLEEVLLHNMGMGREEFIAWLREELHQRGWVAAELTKRGRIPSSQISRVMTGTGQASADLCIRIARVLQLPPEEVLRRAGILPRRLGPEDTEELLYYYANLDKHDRATLLSIARTIHGLYGADKLERE